MGCGASKSSARVASELKAPKIPAAAVKPVQHCLGTSIVVLLNELKLSSYLSRFEEQGWDDVDHISRLDRDGLVNLCRDVGLGQKPGHQARFIEHFRPEHVRDDNMVVSIGDIESIGDDRAAACGVLDEPQVEPHSSRELHAVRLTSLTVVYPLHYSGVTPPRLVDAAACGAPDLPHSGVPPPSQWCNPSRLVDAAACGAPDVPPSQWCTPSLTVV